MDFVNFFSNIGIPPDPVANEDTLRNHIGRIPYTTFQGIVGGFFATAVITVAARMVIRIKSRRGISLDDYFLLFGLTCLTGATVLLLKYTRLIYMTEAVRLLQQQQMGTETQHIKIPNVIFTLDDILDMADVSKIVDAIVCLTWSATFAVKASFLALFRVLIRRISRRITIYYWVVVGCTAVTWAFMMAESFIFCSTFGLGSIKCLDHTNILLYLNVLATILDIITDMMIISIPILVLQKSQMKPKQKFGLGVFLCLSLVMILITIIRASNLPNRNPLSTWQYIWLYLEACVATIMASITAFRTLFVQRSSADKKQKAAAAAISPPSGPYYSSVRERLLRKMGRWKLLGGGWQKMSSSGEQGGSGPGSGSGSGKGKGEKDLPQVPSATMTGIRTFIYRNGRTVDEESVVRSGLYTFDEEDQTFHETKP